jgi:hypothetical protein
MFNENDFSARETYKPFINSFISKPNLALEAKIIDVFNEMI